MSMIDIAGPRKNVRTRLNLVKSLLRRAFDEGRGQEIKDEIRSRLFPIRKQAEIDKPLLELARAMDSQPYAVRRFNMFAEVNGLTGTHERLYAQPEAQRDISAPAPKRILH